MTVAIAVPLTPELVRPIRAVDPRLEVLYEPELLPPVRYPNDHRGVEGFRREAPLERQWSSLIARAEVLFGIPAESPQALADVVRSNPRLRWVQATAAGAGEQVRAAALTEHELARVMITSSSGVHAVPLAEFCLFGLLAFTKDLRRIEADQGARRWGHYAMGELRERTLVLVGVGNVGREVARLASAFGMRVIGINRDSSGNDPHIGEMRAIASLEDVLPSADAIVITLPLTDETRKLIDRAAIDRIKPGATLINVGRGGVLDEPALVAALRDGRLAGAALDVYDTEPLPLDNPLWELPNVLLTPHTAALSLRENERIVELFCENLRRYLREDELISRVDPRLLY